MSQAFCSLIVLALLVVAKAIATQLRPRWWRLPRMDATMRRRRRAP
jgi:hypothetical protein